MARIGILGATGAMGRAIGATLHGRGEPHRVIARSEGELDRQFGADPLAERRTWDPGDPDAVRGALEGLESVIFAVGVPYWRFDLHPIVMRAALEGARAAGVQRMLLVDNIYPYGTVQTNPVREDQPRVPTTYKGRMRKEQEDLLLDAHARGEIEAIVVRFPDFYGPDMETSFMSNVFAAALSGGTAQVIGPIDVAHQYVYVPDAGAVLARLIGETRAIGKVWHYAGSPDTITQRAFVDKIFAAAGSKPKMMVSNKIMLQALGIFNRQLREMVEMHYLLTDPVILDDSALRALLPGLPARSYDDGIRATIDAERARLRELVTT